MADLAIGQVAKQTGVTVETLRFYEKEALLPRPARGRSGYRIYPPEVVRRVVFIQRAKELGFSLKEIAELLNLRHTPQVSCAEVKRVATAKMANIEKKLKDLQGMHAALATLAARCDGKDATGECPILDALEDNQEK